MDATNPPAIEVAAAFAASLSEKLNEFQDNTGILLDP